ncbi:MAG: bifunctional nuclease family protein [Ignavibacteria bacterium]|nr:bifunctional nuclease family protein [Ignavibacteria bacterium]
MNEFKDNIQVEIFGLSLSSSLSGGGYAIILKEIDGDRRLPIIIGQFEAQAIALQLEGIVPPRPLTHDLLKNVIEIFGYSVDYIVINELRDSTFFAKIKLDSDSVDEIDARPSDAIALALKSSSPIYVASYILDEIGFIPEKEEASEQNSQPDKQQSEEKEPVGEDPKQKREKKLLRLKKDLDDAVSKEDYETAASLRDEIKKLENYNFN